VKIAESIRHLAAASAQGKRGVYLLTTGERCGLCFGAQRVKRLSTS